MQRVERQSIYWSLISTNIPGSCCFNVVHRKVITGRAGAHGVKSESVNRLPKVHARRLKVGCHGVHDITGTQQLPRWNLISLHSQFSHHERFSQPISPSDVRMERHTGVNYSLFVWRCKPCSRAIKRRRNHRRRWDGTSGLLFIVREVGQQ